MPEDNIGSPVMPDENGTDSERSQRYFSDPPEVLTSDVPTVAIGEQQVIHDLAREALRHLHSRLDASLGLDINQSGLLRANLEDHFGVKL